ncbi:MAG: mechanosensitive ion channel family protein [Gammaproteobacteria bacterium]|nr:mechanosensitive ion channel family protein [Gammaproteobacteria bacterium]
MISIIEDLGRFVPLLGTIAAVVVLLFSINWVLRRRWHGNPDAQFRFQLIMLALSFAGLLAIIVAMPINDAVRGQLLSLIGILLSAAIALSSTTFIGNIMAGIMLKVVRNARPGDFITVADLTGRITEMDLLHTEIQTEFRDLVTVPNLYMVTQPLQVVRASGTIIQAEVSLGYDVAHTRAAAILCDAATNAGLKDGFAQVRELGDFSVTYRVAGLLEDVTSLISARSRLRAAMLDALHSANVEIVSPNFMNTRTLGERRRIIPTPSGKAAAKAQPQVEHVAFDKAEDAASVEKIRIAIEQTEARLKALGEVAGDVDPAERSVLEEKKLRLIEQLKAGEGEIRAKEAAEKDSGEMPG